MKFFLSSYKLADNAPELARLLGQNKKAVYIANALDYSTDKDRIVKHKQEDTQDLEGIGLEVEELDLKKYFGKAEQLQEHLKDIELIYISGGNVFDLRIAMYLSGFDKFIQESLKTDLIYAGYSAAVCVLSPTLRGYDIVDKPNNHLYGDYETIYKGLGIIDWQFAPHFQSDHHESSDIDQEIAYYKKHNLPYKALRDGEFVIEEK